MARALLGHVGTMGTVNQHALAHEVMRLRRRVAELESEVDQLREHDAPVLETETLELELHLAGSPEPVLA